ncbi:MAG: AAA family ATPase [Huintestinicola sp.]|uniref:cytidylate kinase-like family protein n=1 Tax=Huintestinicola sp. TaxID=2981661 RepID=UPI003F0A04A7
MIYTIGREFGSGGHEIGAELARWLGIPLYDKDFIEKAEAASGIKSEILEQADEKKENRWLYTVHYNGAENLRGLSANEILFRIQSSLVLEYAGKSDCVIVGRCADHILDKADIQHLSIFISAPLEARIKRISNIKALTEKEAAALIARTDKQRKSYYEYYTGKSWGKPCNYDLCLNSASFGIERTAEIIAQLRGMLK